MAADIATCPEVPDSQCWIYQALPNGDSANSWARDTLTVHDPAPSDEEFIVKINQQRLPYVHPSGHKQYFGCHLLLRGDGRHSFYVHGSHVFLDARPALWILRRVFGAVVQGGKHGEPTHWGEEIANLPVDLHVAVGMMSTDVTNLPALDVPADLRMDEVCVRCSRSSVPCLIAVNHQMSVGILPQRNTVTVLGRCVRVQRRLEKDMFAALRTQLKAHGLSVSMLCDAAHVLATLSMCHPLPKDAHVTLYFSVYVYILFLTFLVTSHHSCRVALHRFLKAEYLKERYTTSCMTTVPLVVPAAKIPTDATPRARLLATMQLLKAQYAHWLAHPAFPLATELSAARPFTIKPNVFCPLVINLGVVDSDEYVPRTIRGEVGEIKMLDFVYGHRLTVDYSGM